MMEEPYGCNLINTKRDGLLVTEFVGKYHVHVLVRQGQMTFSDGKNSFTSRQNDLAIWQMSNTIQRIECSDDFEADVLLLSGEFLQQFNPEMVWASKGFVFIRINPSFHLDEEALRLMNDDFALFRNRLSMQETGFKREILGRVMQIFIYDLWTVCQHGLSQMDTNDNIARIFLRFLTLAQQNARTEREVAFYADLLCITPKYLSQVSRTITGLPASGWIQFYASFELVSLLNDTTKTLTEVSDLMHFENVSHFSRYVKKTLGKTPSEFRSK
jgi:AraC-like DNA-binding protein